MSKIIFESAEVIHGSIPLGRCPIYPFLFNGSGEVECIDDLLDRRPSCIDEKYRHIDSHHSAE